MGHIWASLDHVGSLSVRRRALLLLVFSIEAAQAAQPFRAFVSSSIIKFRVSLSISAPKSHLVYLFVSFLARDQTSLNDQSMRSIVYTIGPISMQSVCIFDTYTAATMTPFATELSTSSSASCALLLTAFLLGWSLGLFTRHYRHIFKRLFSIISSLFRTVTSFVYRLLSTDFRFS